MADPLYPQQQRNYLDDILDQAFDDLEMERQRQESIINANDPDRVLSQLNKVDKQIENEPEEVQQAVRQKVYKPGYFDRNREMMDWKPQGKSVVEPKDNTKSIDETIQRYEQYEQLFPQYFQEEYDKVVQDLGQVKTSEDRTVIRGPFSEEPTYTEQDLETKAITQAKKRLSDEGILEPKRTFLGTLKETFTDYKKFGSKLPYLGGGVEAYEALDLLQSIKDIQRGTADQADFATVMNAQLEMERDSDFGAMVIDIMLQLPAYAFEFATTGGTYTAGRKAGQKALQESVNWVLSKQGKKIIKEGADRFGLKTVKGVVGATTGTLARTVDPRMFSRVVANVSRELLPDYELNRKLDGKLEVLSSNEKSLGKSIVDGYLLTYLELLGEQSGEAIPFLGKELKTFLKSKPESAVHGLLKSLIRKNPDVPPGKFMQGVRQAGIQSVPVELMEERFTDFLQSGVEGHEFEWPTAEEWLAEIVAIGGFSLGMRQGGKALDKRAEKKLEKAKAKGLEAIESGQLRQLTDQDISDFGRSLTKEEAMEIGIAQETGEIDPGSELGKEMIRRNLEMEKFPETDTEFREAGARANIKEQQMEGKDFVGELINKAESESGIAIEREYLDRTLADEVEQEGWTEEETKKVLQDHGIDEETDPNEIIITGTSFGGSVRISTAGTETRMADEYVAVQEEMAEEYYKAEQENNPEFENEISEDRRKYNEATGEQDTGESNLEWFSSKAIQFSTQGKVHQSIGAKLTEIFNRFIDNARTILKDAFKLRKAIREGKVSDSLLKKLEEATDFKKVGEKVKQAKNKNIEKVNQGKSFRMGVIPNNAMGMYGFGEIETTSGIAIYGGIPDGAPGFGGSGVVNENDKDADGNFTIREKFTVYNGFNPDGTKVGDPIADVVLRVVKYEDKDPQVFGLINIEVKRGIKKQGLGKTIISSLMNSGLLYNDELKIYDIQKKARGFWKKMGTDMPLLEGVPKHRFPIKRVDGLITKQSFKKATEKPKIILKGKFKEDPTYRMSIAEGMEKLRTKPALRAPAKGVKLSKGQKKTRIKRALNNTIKDIKKLEKNDPKAFTEAIGWYADDILKAIDILSNETQFAKDHPVLFTTILAITSNGQKVPVNYNDTADLLVEFDKNGKLPVVDDVTTESGKPKKVLKIGDRVLGGVRNDTIGKHGDRLQFLIDKFGIEGAETWLTSEWTGREILQILEESGTGKTVAGLKITGTYKGMRIFGRKLGNFGLSFHDLTDEAVIDVWMTRWWNRQMGTPYLEDKSVAESPRNPQEFDLIVDAVQAITDEINKGSDTELSVASVQALIWYNEKDLYEKSDINVEKAINYSEVANARNTTTKESKAQPSAQDAELKGSEEGTPGVSQEVQEGDQKTSYRLAPTFYSKAERVVTEQFPPTMKSQSVENFLKKNQVKPEEIQWLDLETLLKGKQKVTKEELQEWIQANKIEVEDVMKIDENDKVIFRVGDLEVYRDNELVDYTREFDPSDPVENLKMVLVEDLEINKWDIMKDPKRELLDYLDQKYQDQNDQLEYSEQLGENTDNYIERIAYISDLQSKVKQDDFEFDLKEAKTPKYPEHQLPGEKEDYRELLLTLPVDDMGDPFVGYVIFKNEDDVDEFLGDVSIEGMENLDYGRTQKFKVEFNIPATKANMFERILNKYSFSFKETNSATRKALSTNKDVFTTGHYEEPNILAHIRFNTRRSPTGEQVLFIEELQSDWHTKGREKGYKKDPKKIEELQKEFVETVGKRNILKNRKSPPYAEVEKLDNKLVELKEKLNDLGSTGVPDAPFKNNGWVELIMKRMLRYASENNFDRIAWTTANQQIDRWKNELRQNVDQISWQKLVTAKQVAIRKMLYEQNQDTLTPRSVLINGLKKNESVFNQTIPLEGETTINGQKVTLEGLLGKQMATQIRNSEDRTGVIEGKDLTVGGQGFKVVYDFAIKKILNKMGKKFNAKVDQVEIEMSLVDVVSGEPQLQPSIPVTRKMKESALKGQPTFRASKMTSTDDVLSSPSFKKWFKGSQVKDKDGKPLVVYHGTNNVFDKFSGRRGNWFSEDPKFSSNFAGDIGGNIHPVYLSIKNPLDFNKVFDDAKQSLTRKQFINRLKKVVGDKASFLELALDDAIQYSEAFDGLRDLLDDSDKDSDLNQGEIVAYSFTDLFTDENGVMRNWAKDLGYDGIIVPEVPIGYEIVQTYAVFEPTQVKSIFNKGTFNPHDPRISFRMAPTNLVTPLAKIYHEQKGTKKSYTKKDFELDLVRLGYPEETLKTAMDLFGIIRIKQIETDEPTPIEKELKKIQDLHITRSNLKDRIKRAYRLGAVEKEKEITKLQKIVTKYARENLPKGEYKKSEVTGLLAKVRDAKRARELATALERIDRIVDKVNKRSALAKWNKTVKKKATVKKVGGIGRGKVGADVQDIVNDIRGKKKGEGIMDLSPADVELEIELLGKVIGESEDGEPTDDQALRLNLLLTYGAMKHKTPEEITRATEQFDELVTAGRMQVIEDQEAYKERMKEIGEEILEVITGGAGAQTQAGAQTLGLKKKGLLADIKETLSTFDSQNQSLEYIFDKLSRLDKTSKPLESAINNYFMPMIRQARLAEYSGLVEMNTMLREKAEEIFGVKDGKLTKRLNENTVNTINIRHRDGVDGPIIYSELTYNQAYKKWMELKDPTLENTFEKMGWDINKTKRQIEDQLPKDMIEWAEWQLYEFYPMYYHRVNEVFRKRFNVNMPFNPMYSPISRRIGARADEGDDTLNKSKSPMGSMTSAGSLKGRVSNVEELDWADGDTTMMKHITEMEHFIHYTQVMREMRSVFMNRNTSRSIIDFHGQGISRVLNKFMDDIARGGVDRAQNLEWMDKLRANFSRSVIGVNPVVYLKQLASIPAYMADIPALDWSTEFAKVFNPLEFKRMYRTLSKSKMVEMRYDQGFERDMVLALQNQKPGKLISGTDWVNTFAYAFTKMGDKQAIFLGGWTVYKYHKKKALKEGKSLKDAEAIAMRKFEEASLRSQQASNVEDLADFQRRGSAYKLFTMFMTSPNQYYRMVIGGYRNLVAGRGSRSENLRRIFVGQLLLPTLFQFISNGFKWDDKDQAVSILLFPFSGLLFFGQAFEYMIRSAFNVAYPMGPVSILDPFVDIGKGVGKTFDGKEFDNKKVFKILDDYISGLSKIFGVPYSGPKRSVENTIEVLTEDSDLSLKDKTLKGIGFRMEEKKKKKKKKKPKVGGPVYAY